MFKRDVRSVVGDEFPDLKGLSDTLAHAADSAKDVIQHGQEAVEGLKDQVVYLGFFKFLVGFWFSFSFGKNNIEETMKVCI